MSRESITPAPAPRGKRRAVQSESESEDSSPRSSPQKRKKRPVLTNDSDSDEGGAPRKNGAARSNGHAHAEEVPDDGETADPRGSGSDDEAIEEDGAAAAEATASGQGAALSRILGSRPDYQRGDDGYVAGSIKRIKMVNFLTYDSAEFAPGPHLNMILGPNGTGKSSIAAAIAIGLGFKPRVMGRATDLKAYVKQGAEEAQLEIELKGFRGKKNPVIGMTFTRARDASEWTLQGQKCPRSKIHELVASYGVVADNLCSFLPQDKVADFAKLAPTQVLEETMRAAGDSRLSTWHKKLCENGQRVIKYEQDTQREMFNRDALQKQVDRLAPDVATYEQRQERETERIILEHKVMLREVVSLQRRHGALRNRKIELRRLLKRHAESKAPLLSLIDKQDAKLHKAQVAEDDISGKRKEQEKKIKAQATKWENIKRDAEAIDGKLSVLKTKQKRRQEDIETQKKRMAAAEKILAQDISEQRKRAEALAQTKKDKSRAARDMDRALQDLRARVEERQRDFQDIDREINQARQEQVETRLSSVEALREQTASDFDPSIRFLLEWLKNHGDELEGEVHKPPMISVNVRDTERAWQVEMCTNLAQRKTFICESKKDYARLLALNNTEYPRYTNSRGVSVPQGRVRLNLARCEPTERWANPPRPTDSQTLAELGFDGYAVDFIDAAPTVICYLNQNANLHSMALSTKPGSAIDEQRASALGIPMWVTSDQATRAQKSRYGQRQAQFSTTTKIENAKAFALVVDQEAIRRVQNTIGQKRKERKDKEAGQKDLEDEYERERKKMEKALDIAKKYDDELNEIKAAIATHARAQEDYNTAQRRLAEQEAMPSLNEERNELRAAKLRFARQLMEPQSSIMTAAHAMVNLVSDAGEVFWRRKQASHNFESAKAKLEEGDERTQELEREYDQVDKDAREVRAQFENGGHRFHRSLDEQHPDVREQVSALMRAGDNGEPMPELEDLQNELEEVKARLALSTEIQPHVIAKFRKISKDLEQSEKAVQEREQELSHARATVKKILDNFNPALDTLVDVVSKNFSAAFERIGCAGEVEVDRVEGKYDEWGINIKVSYREGEPLSLLTSARQSGGERSLATVTYLMSLSAMARTPFSLVDEINQGMDQRAERLVHNSLVEVTCGADAGQYFLITPKLLTGLRYHQKMKVLIINNGVYLPSETDKIKVGSLKSNLLKFQKARAIAAR